MLIERIEDRWNTNRVSVGDVMRLDEPGFDARIGHCWAKGRLKQGDLIVAVAHSGDGFFDYVLVHELPFLGCMTLEPVGKPFGAYTIGRKVASLSQSDADGIRKGVPAAVEYDESFGYKDPFASDESADIGTSAIRSDKGTMRELPDTTRIAIATISMRHRASRSRTDALRAKFGSESIATITSEARTIELWNTLVTVRQRVDAEVHGRRITLGNAKAFLRLVALQAAAFRRSRA